VVQESTPQFASSLMLIGAIVAGVRRKSAIGGWLFFYFWQVVASCALLIAYSDWSRYTPRGWVNQAQYFVFVLAAAPRVMILVALAALAGILVRTRDWRWVVVTRYTLIIFSIFGCLSIGADRLYFPERIVPDVATLMFPVVYAVYFNVSTRVHRVFEHGAASQSAAPALD
jgi:hypothetical protein